jgi:2-dehydropantoate 2-reductase
MTVSEESPRVLVLGSGAIGGTISGHLLHAGAHTQTVVTNPEIRAALARHGFRHRGFTALRHVHSAGLLASPEEVEGQVDFVLLAVQPPQVEAAVRAVQDRLAPGGLFVCFQNGLAEERVARLVARDRVVGAVVAWGASMPEPGVFDRTSEGGFTVGRLDGSRDPVLERLARLLACVGPVNITNNLLGARWSKLAINCAVSTLGTIAGQHIGALLRAPMARRLGLEIITEVTEVARASGVRLEPVSTTFDVGTLAPGPREPRGSLRPMLLARHALLFAIGRRYRRLRSSMLRAMEKGRPPAVDFLNGEIVEHGQRVGYDAHVNRAACDIVWKIARGELQPGEEALSLLYRVTAGGRS